jgi:hypothetical protein
VITASVVVVVPMVVVALGVATPQAGRAMLARV